jgi:glycosyltransferase domain-containing protein
MNNSNLDNITIVVPTYKRHPFLKRLLKFYGGFAIPIKILILDSTPDEPSDKELKQLLSAVGTVWKIFDPDITYWDKIAKGSEFIQTDYVTLCADDDFIIPNALIESMKFLASHSDYSSAQGLCFGHTSYERAKQIGFLIFPLYQYGKSSIHKTAMQRVQSYLSGHTGYYPLYAVQRTKAFQIIWNETSRYVSDWNLHELFSSCLSFCFGKMKILPVLYSSREPNAYAVNDYEMFKRTFSPVKVEKAISGVAKHLSENDGLLTMEAMAIVEDAFKAYIDRANQIYKDRESSNNQIITRLWRRIKQSLAIRSRLRAWFYQGCHSSIYPKYFDDFKKVKDAVLSANLTEKELNVSRMDFANQGKL